LSFLAAVCILLLKHIIEAKLEGMGSKEEDIRSYWMLLTLCRQVVNLIKYPLVPG
jgi:hypothetical protein